MRNWRNYNERLVRRGEILISGDILQNWDKELVDMNCKKQGRKFLFPESFMKVVGYARIYFGLPYRQTEGLLRTYGTTIPKVPDYTAIHKRINKLDLKVKTHLGNDSLSQSILQASRWQTVGSGCVTSGTKEEDS
jgi:hypothetical protein